MSKHHIDIVLRSFLLFFHRSEDLFSLLCVVLLEFVFGFQFVFGPDFFHSVDHGD